MMSDSDKKRCAETMTARIKPERRGNCGTTSPTGKGSSTQPPLGHSPSASKDHLLSVSLDSPDCTTPQSLSPRNSKNGSAQPDESSSLPAILSMPFQNKQTFLIISAGESMRECFGEDWTDSMLQVSRSESRSSMEKAKVVLLNANQPAKNEKFVYGRRRKLEHRVDSPLTEIGYRTSMILGKCLRQMCDSQHMKMVHWYSAPELRCMQTVSAIYAGAGWRHSNSEYGTLVRPGLCDYYGSDNSIPRFIDHTKLDETSEISIKSHMRINVKDYAKTLAKLWSPMDGKVGRKETYDDYHHRFREAVCDVHCRAVANEDSGITVIVVPQNNFHPLALQLSSKGPSSLSEAELCSTGDETPQLAVLQLEATPTQNFAFVPPYIPGFGWRPLKHASASAMKLL